MYVYNSRLFCFAVNRFLPNRKVHAAQRLRVTVNGVACAGGPLQFTALMQSTSSHKTSMTQHT